MEKPLILVTNDDGIESPGLLAAVKALADIGEILVAAPLHQQSGMGHSLPGYTTGSIHRRQLSVNGTEMIGYAVEGSPAQAVAHAILELAPRVPDLVVSGINFGENLSIGVTVSGTVGAALHAAHMGVRSLAVSLETSPDLMYYYEDRVDFSVAGFFTCLFAGKMLRNELATDARVLKIDVPAQASPDTPWRMTRLDLNPYYYTTPGRDGPLEMPGKLKFGFSGLGPSSPDTDVAAFLDGVVSVTPLSLDLTSRVDLSVLDQKLRQD